MLQSRLTGVALLTCTAKVWRAESPLYMKGVHARLWNSQVLAPTDILHAYKNLFSLHGSKVLVEIRGINMLPSSHVYQFFYRMSK